MSKVDDLKSKYLVYPIKEYNYWNVWLYPNQYYLGRIFVYAKRESAEDLMETTDEEQKELFAIGSGVNRALKKLFNFDLMNYAAFANTLAHLHLHFIPRYQSPRIFDNIEFIDENWGKNYAPYDKNFSIPRDTLIKIAEAIKNNL